MKLSQLIQKLQEAQTKTEHLGDLDVLVSDKFDSWLVKHVTLVNDELEPNPDLPEYVLIES